MKLIGIFFVSIIMLTNASITAQIGDPAGFIFCQETGEIITGGIISVTPLGGGTAFIIEDGSSGSYSFETFGADDYVLSYAPPVGYSIAPSCPSQGSFTPTGFFPIILDISPDPNNFFPENHCPTWYSTFEMQGLLAPLVLNNNIPLIGCCELADSYSQTHQCVWNSEENRSESIVDVTVNHANTTGDITVSLMNIAGIQNNVASGPPALETQTAEVDGDNVFSFTMEATGENNLFYEVTYSDPSCDMDTNGGFYSIAAPCDPDCDSPGIQENDDPIVCEGDSYELSVTENFASYQWYTTATPLTPNPAVDSFAGNLAGIVTDNEREIDLSGLTGSPAGTTFYFYAEVGQAPDSDYCTDITPVEAITVYTSQPVTLLADQNPICPGQDITLTANDAGNFASYDWFNSLGTLSMTTTSNTITVPVFEATTFSVIAYNAAGCSSTNNVQVTMLSPLAPVIDPSGEIELCPFSSQDLTAHDSNTNLPYPIGYTYQWYFDGNTIPAGTSGVYSLTNVDENDAGTYAVVVTSPLGCYGIADFVQVIINEEPILDITALPADECIMEEFEFRANTNGNGDDYDILWTLTESPSSAFTTFTGEGPHYFSFNDDPDTQYELQIDVIDLTTDCTWTDSWFGQILNAPEITIGEDFSVCDGVCGSLVIATEDGNQLPAINNIEWNGNPITIAANELSAQVCPIANQGNADYVYSVDVEFANGCVRSASIVVEAINELHVNAGVDQTVCQLTDATLSATQFNALNAGIYSWIQVGATPSVAGISFPNSSTTAITGLNTAGNYMFEVSVSIQGTTGAICTSTDQVVITVIEEPIFTITATNNEICSDEQETIQLAANLDVNIPAATTFFWSASPTAADAYLSCNPCSNPSVTIPDTFNGSTITYSATGLTTGDNAVECSSIEEFEITVHQPPALLILDQQREICDGSCTTLSVTSLTTPISSVFWSGGPIDNNTVVNPTVCPPGSAQGITHYRYYVTVYDINGCMTEGWVDIDVTPSIEVTAMENATFCENTEIELTATSDLASSRVNGTVSLTWAQTGGPVGALASTLGASVTTNTLGSGVYEFTVTVTQESNDGTPNCIDSDVVTITVLEEPIVQVQSTTFDACMVEETISINAVVTTAAAATFEWISKDDPNLNFLSCTDCAQPDFLVTEALAAGTIPGFYSYTVVASVTGDNNVVCQNQTTVAIEIHPYLFLDEIEDVVVCDEWTATSEQRCTDLNAILPSGFGKEDIMDYTITPMVGISNIAVEGFEICFDVTPSNEITQYTVNLTGENDCTARTMFYAYESPVPVVSITYDDPACINEVTTFNFDGEAGAAATYTWDFAGGEVVFSGGNDSDAYDGIPEGPGPHNVVWSTPPGVGSDYIVELTVEEGGCIQTNEFDVEINSGFEAEFDVVDASLCGVDNGEINFLSAVSNETGAPISVANLIFEWSGPNVFTSTASSITGLTPGTYYLELRRDIDGCSYQFEFDVAAPNDLGLNALVAYSGDCAENNAGIHVEIIGGTAPYTYSYYRGGILMASNTVDTQDNYEWELQPGAYDVIIEDVNGCSVQDDILIDTVNGPEVVIGDLVYADCGLANGEVNFTVFGDNSFLFELFADDVYPGGNIFASGTPVTLDYLRAGDYTLTVTDINGCTTIVHFTIEENNPTFTLNTDGFDEEFDINVTITDGICPNNPNGSVNAPQGEFAITENSGGPYNYTWYNPDGTMMSPADPLNITALETGLYKLEVCDGDCCRAYMIPINPTDGPHINLMEIENNLCPDIDMGTVEFSVTGNGPLLYNIHNITAQGGIVGSGVPVSGEPVIVYGLEPGMYMIVARDTYECESFVSFEITDPYHFEIFVDRYDLDKCDAGDGKVCMVITGGTGPFEVSTDIPAIIPYPMMKNIEYCIYGMDAFTEYLVTVTDANGCSADYHVDLEQPEDCFDCEDFCIEDLVAYNSTCDTDNDGSLRVDVMDGTGPFNFVWTNISGAIISETLNSSEFYNEVENVSAGVYIVTITDANNCVVGGMDATEEGTIEVNNIGGPIVEVDQIIASSCASSNGQVEFSVISGAEPFTYLLVKTDDVTVGIDGSIVSIPDQITLAGLPAGKYVLTITDANGCKTIKVVDIDSVDFPYDPQITIVQPTCGEPTGEIAVTFTDPLNDDENVDLSNFTLTWYGPNGDFTPSPMNNPSILPVGLYYVDVSYQGLCETTLSIPINPSDGPEFTNVEELSAANCHCGDDGQLRFSVSGNGEGIIGYIIPGVKSQPYYMPYPTEIADEVVGGLSAGEYEIQVITQTGCFAFENFVITDPEKFEITIDRTHISECYADDGSISLNVFGGTSGYEFYWEHDGSTTSELSGLAPGNYNVIITDEHNCPVDLDIEIENAEGCLDCLECGCIGSSVWEDLDVDGLQDANEPGIENVTVTIFDVTGAEINSMQTDENGWYEFCDLTPGEYYVLFDSLEEFIPTAQDVNSNLADEQDSDMDPNTGASHIIDLVFQEIDSSIDAGFYRLACLGDYAFVDHNCDGIQNEGDAALMDVEVELFYKDELGTFVTTNMTVLTDEAGLYEFCNLMPGVEFQVLFSLPDGYYLTESYVGDVEENDSNPNINTMNSETIVLESNEYNDTIDAGYCVEEVVDCTDFIVEVLTTNPGCDGIMGSITITPTGGDGSYTVLVLDENANEVSELTNLPEGEYTVQVLDGQGCDFDASYNLLMEDNCCSIGDFVWEDFDGNGIQDIGEPGIEGVMVTLYTFDDNNIPYIVDQMNTDENGYYLFDGIICGIYYLHFETPEGFELTMNDEFEDDSVDSDANPDTGETENYELSEESPDNVTVAAGFHRNLIDLELDKSVNPTIFTEGDIITYTISISNEGPGNATGVSVTDNLPSQVSFIASNSATYDATTGVWDIGDLFNGEIQSLQLYVQVNDASDEIWNFAEVTGHDQEDIDSEPANGNAAIALQDDEDRVVIYPEVEEQNNALGDIVWLDLDEDGIQDSGEPGIEGAIVVLNNQNGFVDLMITDENGMYYFDELSDGCYYVDFTTPAGLIPTVQNNGNDNFDSDANPIGGESQQVCLEGGEIDNTVDAGYILPEQECDSPLACDAMYVCTEAMTSIVICPDTCPIIGDYTITDAVSTYHCSISINENGCVIYTPLPNMELVGSDYIFISVEDEAGNCFTIEVIVLVGNCNDAPIAIDDQADTECGENVFIDVLGNDIDPDGDEISICGFTQPDNGVVSQLNGQLLYVPNYGFNGIDYFTYNTCDDQGESDDAIVTITVADGFNIAPIANADYGLSNGETITIAVLNNDNDPDGDNLSICGVGETNHGTVSIIGNNLVYTPDNDYSGYDSFTYFACDDDPCNPLQSNICLVTVEIDQGCENNPEYLCTGPMTPITICPDFCALNGDFTIQNAGSIFNCSITYLGECFSYIPLPGFTGMEQISITACDDAGNCDDATVFVTVGDCDGNAGPNAVNDIAITDCDAMTINVLINDTDIDNDVLSICGYTNPSNGTISQVGESFIYTPNAGYIGTDSFTYNACDDTESDSATVFISVTCPEEGCEADDIYTCAQPMQATTICVEFCDDNMSISNLHTTYDCSLTMISDYCFSYISLPAYTGTDVVTVTGCYGNECEDVIVYVEVTEDCTGGGLGTPNGDDLSKACDRYLPNAFSPNYDGINDKVSFKNLEECYGDESATLRIVNSKGELLFEKSAPVSALIWEGRDKYEKDITSGTYFYSLQIGHYAKKGFIELRR